jgi:putative cardiolipin synthase
VRKLLRLIGLLSCVTVAGGLFGCASLEPAERLPELASAKAVAPVWAPLAERPDRDEHVLLNEGMSALDLRLRAIDSARSSIDLQTFLWRGDEAGTAVKRHLLAAADRGVRVRILVDDTFLIGRDAALLRFAEHAQIDYRVFNPHKQRGVDFLSAEALNVVELGRLDHRMHNKAMIVDGQIAIVGGRNLADEYFGLHSRANFRDVELLLRGPVIEDLSAAFDDYWNSPWSLPLGDIANPNIGTVDSVAAPLPVQLETEESQLAAEWEDLFGTSSAEPATLVVDRPPQGNPAAESEAPVQVAEFLIDLFDEAKEEIVILSAYLIPTPTLEGAVARAVDRGVRVRMLTNSLRSNNHITAHSAYRKHIRTLVGHGVELHEVRVDARTRPLYMLSPTADKELALHAKALVIDHDRVFIGSANLDPRSLRINTELGLLIRSPALNAALREAFAPDFSSENAWYLALAEDGRLVWHAEDIRLTRQPADSFMQQIEDWFLSTLPLEGEM